MARATEVSRRFLASAPVEAAVAVCSDKQTHNFSLLSFLLSLWEAFGLLPDLKLSQSVRFSEVLLSRVLYYDSVISRAPFSTAWPAST